MVPRGSFKLFDLFLYLVGRTGFEPVTFSVSGRRAPAAPTARDDESLPDSGSAGVHHDEPRWRAVQVHTGQLVCALYQAELRNPVRSREHPRHPEPRHVAVVDEPRDSGNAVTGE